MRQAITTRFLGPTNHRGSRVKARCQAGSLFWSWDHAHDPEQNHDDAANALARKLGWIGPDSDWFLVGGGLPDGTGNAYVLVRSTGKVES
jgi:hypothetical protein